MASGQPSLYVMAGPNGAGKSTFARLFLPEYADCREFVNADLIAAGLSPFNPESLNLQAGKLMLERIEALAEAGVDFGFETTLAGKSWGPLLQRFRAQGYRLHIFFLWLPTPELALSGSLSASAPADIRCRSRWSADGSSAGCGISSSATRRWWTLGCSSTPPSMSPSWSFSLWPTSSSSSIGTSSPGSRAR